MTEITDADLFKAATEEDGGQPQPTEPPVPAPSAPEPTPEEPPAPAAEADSPIPSWRLREEAEARRLAEQRASALEARLNEIVGHVNQFRAQREEEERSKKVPDFYEDPKAATEAAVMNVLAPFVQENRRVLMALNRAVAIGTHKEETVNEAEKEFLTAIERGTLDTSEYESVVQSPNRYDAVVRWHRRHKTLGAVGDDPQAWFDRQLEERMKNPDFQARMLESIRGTAPPARPLGTGRRLPPSLSGVTSVAGNGVTRTGVLSDSDLWSHATGNNTD